MIESHAGAPPAMDGELAQPCGGPLHLGQDLCHTDGPCSEVELSQQCVALLPDHQEPVDPCQCDHEDIHRFLRECTRPICKVPLVQNTGAVGAKHGSNGTPTPSNGHARSHCLHHCHCHAPRTQCIAIAMLREHSLYSPTPGPLRSTSSSSSRVSCQAKGQAPSKNLYYDFLDICQGAASGLDDKHPRNHEARDGPDFHSGGSTTDGYMVENVDEYYMQEHARDLQQALEMSNRTSQLMHQGDNQSAIEISDVEEYNWGT